MPRSLAATPGVAQVYTRSILPTTSRIVCRPGSQYFGMQLVGGGLVFLLLQIGKGWGQCARQADTSQCDAYVDCVQGVPTPALCPDGLVFSPEAQGYPCLYPQQVDCAGRNSMQPPQPTADCPRQFGLYRVGDANNCGMFLNCVNGRGFMSACPEGLAFNEETLQCDWPDLVSSCNPEGFLGFACPVTYSPTYGYPAGHRLYRSPNDCAVFFVCEKDKPRLLRCPKGQAFSEETSTCEDAANVTGCYVPAESYNVNSAGSNQVFLK